MLKMNVKTISLLIVLVSLSLLASLWMGQQAYTWLPPQASAESKLVDDLFSFLVVLGSFIFLGITGTLLYTMLTQQVSRFDLSDGPPIEGSVTLEVVWTVIPVLLVFWIAGYSYQVYQQMAVRGPMDVVHMHMGTPSAYAAAADAEPIEEIDVLAKQWSWAFHYPQQNVTTSELHLPVDRRVRLSMTSEDVIHGFYIPAFRLKQDILPKRTIEFEFTPVREGKYRLDDSQFSGTYFAVMQADVLVESPEHYSQWLTAVAKGDRVPAANSAYTEYNTRQEKGIRPGWPTIKPAAPPLVNQG